MARDNKAQLNVDYSELSEKEILQLIHQEAIKKNQNDKSALKTLKSIKSNTDLFAWAVIISFLFALISIFI